ncbi:hypothetical protein FKP32DRAFT_655179 [Trametes sanguinea]|nr:hypothetical protein FKP32DRAFT_655179 [Trametes sanguinea]
MQPLLAAESSTHNIMQAGPGVGLVPVLTVAVGMALVGEPPSSKPSGALAISVSPRARMGTSKESMDTSNR